MNQYIHKIRQYLSEQEPNYGKAGIQSLAEFLYWYYTNCNPLDKEEIDRSFHEINETMGHMSLQQQDVVIDKVNELCGEFEKYGFCQGFHIGMRLMLEERDWGREGQS